MTAKLTAGLHQPNPCPIVHKPSRLKLVATLLANPVGSGVDPPAFAAGATQDTDGPQQDSAATALAG